MVILAMTAHYFTTINASDVIDFALAFAFIIIFGIYGDIKVSMFVLVVVFAANITNAISGKASEEQMITIFISILIAGVAQIGNTFIIKTYNKEIFKASVSIEEISQVLEEIAKSAFLQASDTENGVQKAASLSEGLENIKVASKELKNNTLETEKLKSNGISILSELMKKTDESNEAIISLQDIIRTTSKSADEIRRLAEQSSESTKRINEIIDVLQSNMEIAFNRMEQTADTIKIQTKSIISTQSIFNNLALSIANIKKF